LQSKRSGILHEPETFRVRAGPRSVSSLPACVPDKKNNRRSKAESLKISSAWHRPAKRTALSQALTGRNPSIRIDSAPAGLRVFFALPHRALPCAADRKAFSLNLSGLQGYFLSKNQDDE
jgi:hypothetical protein